jgi:hypothetical protein
MDRYKLLHSSMTPLKKFYSICLWGKEGYAWFIVLMRKQGETKFIVHDAHLQFAHLCWSGALTFVLMTPVLFDIFLCHFSHWHLFYLTVVLKKYDNFNIIYIDLFLTALFLMTTILMSNAKKAFVLKHMFYKHLFWRVCSKDTYSLCKYRCHFY